MSRPIFISSCLLCSTTVCLTLLVASLAQAQQPAENQPALEAQKLDLRRLVGFDVQKQSPSAAALESAIQKFQQGQFNDARAALDQARRQDPRLPSTDVLLAKLFSLAQRREVALAMLEQAAINTPDEPDIYLLLGESSLVGNQLTISQLCFDKAAVCMRSFDKQSPRRRGLAFRLLGGYAAVAERRQQWAKAAGYLKRWAKADATNAVAQQRLARATFETGDQETAYQMFQEVVRRDAESASAAAMMAQLLQGKNKIEQAKQYVAQAMQARQANLKTRLTVGIWLLTVDEVQHAKRYVQETVQAHPSSSEAQLLAGVLARLQKNHRAARRYFEQAHRLAPDSFEAANYYALALAADDDAEQRAQGLALAEQTQRKFTNHRPAAIALGWIYYGQGKREQVAKILGRAVLPDQMTPDSNYFVAQIMFDQGRLAQAKGLLETAFRSPILFVYRRDAENLREQIKLAEVRQTIKPDSR